MVEENHVSFSLSEPGRSIGGFSGFVVYCYHLSISLVPSNLVYFIGIKLFFLFFAFFFVALKLFGAHSISYFTIRNSLFSD